MTAEDFSFKEIIARERREDHKCAQAFASACVAGNVDAFYAAVVQLHDNSVDGWRLAFKKIIIAPPPKPDIQMAFLRVWIESKSIQRRVGDDLLTIKGLWRLMPRYSGPEMKLFRGDSFPIGADELTELPGARIAKRQADTRRSLSTA